MDPDPVTIWLHHLAAESGEEAAHRLWQHYYERLIRLARKKLGPAGRRMSDEEDVVLSAFDSFCRRAAAGRFPQLEDREDLWKILVSITAHKACDHQRHELREKRGGGAVRGESALRAGLTGSADGIERVMGREPTAEFAALVAEEYQRLLARLGDESLRQIALMRLENYSVPEIAEALQCGVRTVKRRLALIREIWQGEVEP